jgi:hypothetical protein
MASASLSDPLPLYLFLGSLSLSVYLSLSLSVYLSLSLSVYLSLSLSLSNADTYPDVRIGLVRKKKKEATIFLFGMDVSWGKMGVRRFFFVNKEKKKDKGTLHKEKNIIKNNIRKKIMVIGVEDEGRYGVNG